MIKHDVNPVSWLCWIHSVHIFI